MATTKTGERVSTRRGPLFPRWMLGVVALVIIGIGIAIITGNGSGPKVAEAAAANVASLPIYSAPDGKVVRSLPNPDPTINNQPLVFLVLQDKGDWLQVSLPLPPNGQTGWIRTNQVILKKNHYRVDVSRGAHQLRVYKDDKLQKTYPVAIGTADTPTPGGTYFIRVLLKPPNPNGDYGPYAYGLSGYSAVLTNFNGGTGVIGMHGTNEPQVVGHDASHGCIRMRNADVTDLVTRFNLHLGTRVNILP
jgi:lipoprotein-anchoring transpeptidase ErfK/SrfK